MHTSLKKKKKKSKIIYCWCPYLVTFKQYLEQKHTYNSIYVTVIERPTNVFKKIKATDCGGFEDYDSITASKSPRLKMSP